MYVNKSRVRAFRSVIYQSSTFFRGTLYSSKITNFVFWVHTCLGHLTIPQYMIIVTTARKRSLRRLCFYTCPSVILFTGGGGRRGGPSDTMGYGKRAGGTHPNGMHSCLELTVSRLWTSFLRCSSCSFLSLSVKSLRFVVVHRSRLNLRYLQSHSNINLQYRHDMQFKCCISTLGKYEHVFFFIKPFLFMCNISTKLNFIMFML